MRLLLVGLGILLTATVAAYAGGLADALVETTPVEVLPNDDEGGLPSWVIPVAIVALLAGVAVASSGDDDDDDDEDTDASG